MNAYEIQEALEANLLERRRQGIPLPDQIYIPADHKIPEGTYIRNGEGLWVFITTGRGRILNILTSKKKS